MYKSSDKKSKQPSESIVRRVISKFKMAKRGSQIIHAKSESRTEDSEERSANGSKQKGPDVHRMEKDEREKDENRRISLKDLPLFCDDLQNFISRIRSIHHLQFITYDYPEILRIRFETNVLELDSMLKEIKAALTNISKQKAQQNFVTKDITAVKKILSRFRDDEFREMEKVVALYDKSLFARWETVKMTHKPEILKTLLTDVKCKQLALENLDVLITRKLGHLKTFPPIIAREIKSEKEKSIIPLPLFASCLTPEDRKSRIPLPPPLPPPPSLASRNNARKLTAQRRQRLRNQNECSNDLYSLETNLIDLPSVPLTFNNAPNNLILDFNGNLINQPLSSTPISNETVSTTPRGESTNSLQEEMNTVLQALFGDLRNGREPIDVTNDERSDNSSMNKNIELHSIRDTES